MTFNDVLKYDLAVFPIIFPNRATVLNQLFVVNGNGMNWNEKGGALESGLGEGPQKNELVAIERFVGAGLHKAPVKDGGYIPTEILKHLNSMQIPADIEDRLSQTDFTGWYPMSPGFNNLEKLPDNIPADWLNAAFECASLIVHTPLDVNLEKEVQHTIHHFLDVPIFNDKGKVIGRERNSPEVAEQKARKSVIETRMRIYNIATESLERMTAQFPNHKFEQNPIPTYDKDRPFENTGVINVIPWPVNGDTAPFDLIFEPFEKAIRFAYNMRRKNEAKDIPYDGLPLGHDERVCSFGPEERFTVYQMKYDKEDQGRDALEVILSCMAQICLEQGRRIVQKELKERLNDYFRHLKIEADLKIWRTEQEEKAKTDPKVAAHLRILDRIEAGIKPAHDINDPLEVEVATEMEIHQKEVMWQLMLELGIETAASEVGVGQTS
jgi:hypothetical protein